MENCGEFIEIDILSKDHVKKISRVIWHILFFCTHFLRKKIYFFDIYPRLYFFSNSLFFPKLQKKRKMEGKQKRWRAMSSLEQMDRLEPVDILEALRMIEKGAEARRAKELAQKIANEVQNKIEEEYLKSKGFSKNGKRNRSEEEEEGEEDGKKSKKEEEQVKGEEEEKNDPFSNYSNSADLYNRAANMLTQVYELFLPPLQIRNVVFTVFSSPIELAYTAANFRYCWYNPSVFAALQIKIKDPPATFLVFGSGKIVVTGLRSIEQAKLMHLFKMPKVFNEAMNLKIKLSNFTIQNIVAPAQCCFPDGTPFALDIKRIQKDTSCFVRYTDDLFPGLIYPMKKPKLMVLMFKTGNVVMTGAKSMETLKDGWKKLYYEVCLKYAIRPNAVNTSSVYSLSSRRSSELLRSTLSSNENESDTFSLLERYKEDNLLGILFLFLFFSIAKIHSFLFIA
jgi:transcription initiation factor TFIID TATA-box-binding protein